MDLTWLREARGFPADEEAAVGVEYGLLIALIALAIFGAVGTFGTTVYNSFYALIYTLPF